MRRGLLVLTALLLALPAWLAGQPGSASPEAASTQPARAEPHAPAGARITDDGWFPPRTTRPEHTPRPEQPRNVFVLPIREMILEKTHDSLRRKVLQLRAQGADVVVFDLDTWGGALGAALDIARLIKTELKDLHTIAYVRSRAISAGALIAVACDDIIVVPDDVQFGDAAPVTGTGQPLEGVEREKAESPTRNSFADSAERNGYPVALAQSMVSINLEVWLVRNRQTRELRYVLAGEFRNQVVNPPRERAGRDGRQAERPANAQAAWEFLRVVVPDNQLLTLNAQRAVDFGFVRQVVPADREQPYANLMKAINATGEPTVLADTWSEQLVGFLTSPALTGLLLFLAILFAYMELNTPGFGVPGALAILCFAILFGSRYLIGLALWWEVALFVVGVLLLLVEIFILPGFGVAGIAGLFMMLAGLVMIVIDNPPGDIPWPQTELAWNYFVRTLLAMSLGLVGGIVAALAVGKYLPRIPIASRLVLAPAEAGPPPSQTAGVAIGQIGTTSTSCRPVGKAVFGEQLLDVICESGMIERGTAVRVIRLADNAVVVEKA